MQDLLDARRGGCPAGSVFVIEGKVLDVIVGHGSSQFTLDERVDEQCTVEAETERVDARVAFQ